MVKKKTFIICCAICFVLGFLFSGAGVYFYSEKRIAKYKPDAESTINNLRASQNGIDKSQSAIRIAQGRIDDITKSIDTSESGLDRVIEINKQIAGYFESIGIK